jgi:hypothetical protein
MRPPLEEKGYALLLALAIFIEMIPVDFIFRACGPDSPSTMSQRMAITFIRSP